ELGAWRPAAPRGIACRYAGCVEVHRRLLFLPTRPSVGPARRYVQDRLRLITIGSTYGTAAACLLRSRRRGAQLHPRGRADPDRATVHQPADPPAGSRARRAPVHPRPARDQADPGRPGPGAARAGGTAGGRRRARGGGGAERPAHRPARRRPCSPPAPPALPPPARRLPPRPPPPPG